MDLGAHASFIVIAYALTLAVVGCLIVWVAADHRAQLRTLADLESRGIIRRSGKAQS